MTSEERAGERDEPQRLPEYAERVLDVAELIPAGRVMTYGDVAEWLGDGGPRQVGRVMALYGSAVPWWRVVRSDGVLLPEHELRALDHYREESTPLREAGRATHGHLPRLDMRRARWDGTDPGGAGFGDGAGSGSTDRGRTGSGRANRGSTGPGSRGTGPGGARSGGADAGDVAHTGQFPASDGPA